MSGKRSRDDAAPPARIAVIGCGGWCQGWHLPNLAKREDALIVAVVDPSETPGAGGCVPSICQPMTDVAKKYGAPWYKSLDALLADKDTLKLDGVLCAAPHRFHGQIGLAVMAENLHVLMEKPMTADVAEARELYDASLKSPDKCFIINNTANWQEGSLAAHKLVRTEKKIGAVRHVSTVFAAPLAWLFDGRDDHAAWTQTSGTMIGNGFAWGQFSHTFGWLFRVTGLTPARVYAVASTSEKTGADTMDAVVVTCTSGATLNVSGVGTCPDHGFKVLGNWLFGTEGMLNYSALAGADNVKPSGGSGTGARDPDAAVGEGSKRPGPGPRLELWRNDGENLVGPPVEFEHLDQESTGPGSLDAFVRACRGLEYTNAASALDGLKAVCTIDAIYRSAKEGQPVEVRGCEGLD